MEGKIYIDGEIGSKVTLESVRNQVLALGDIDVLNVDINSGGGDVTVGYAIHDYLKGLDVEVKTKAVGICASIATVIFLAGNERSMLPNAELMIHNPWIQPTAPMGASDLEELADYMRVEENKLANFYTSELGADKKTIEGLMDVETRMDLNQSKSIGFVNASSNQYRAVASIKLNNVNNVNDMNDKQTSLLKDIKSLITKVVKGEEEVKAAVITLEDGTSVYIDSEDGEFVGKSIFVEEGGEAAADGTYKLEDGREIVVVDGMITELIEASEEEVVDAEALAAENESLKAEIETLKASMLESSKALEESVVVNAKMTETVAEIVAKVEALEVENKAMASVTVGGKESVKAAVKTPEVKVKESGIASGLASFLKL